MCAGSSRHSRGEIGIPLWKSSNPPKLNPIDL
jgi:hypothetical protein